MLISFVRTVLMYTALIFGVRLLGKRQIGELEPSELVVTMLVADLATIPMQDGQQSILAGLLPMATVLGLEMIVSILCLHSVRMRRILCGKPVILIENGRILQDNLRRTRVTLDELTGHLRQKDVLDISQVQYAILETDGNLSVFPYPAIRPATAKDAGIQVRKQHLPVTIIGDGWLYRENLSRAGKDEAWLRRVLGERNVGIPQTYLLTVDASDRICFVRKGDC